MTPQVDDAAGRMARKADAEGTGDAMTAAPRPPCDRDAVR
jgi:hypothetical protein